MAANKNKVCVVNKVSDTKVVVFYLPQLVSLVLLESYQHGIWREIYYLEIWVLMNS